MSEFFFGTVKNISGGSLLIREDGAASTSLATAVDDCNFVVGDRVVLARSSISQKIYVIGKAIPSQTDWVGLAYAANFADHDGVTTWDPAQYKRVGGVVYFKGLIKSTAAISAGAGIWTMPPGFRQVGQIALRSGLWNCQAVTASTYAPFRLYFDSSGVARTNDAFATGLNIGISHISYPVDA